jgi:NAD(P)H-nitrite reductase large subunit
VADDLLICRCEEITEAEIKEAIREGLLTVNEIKRFSRAGMGLCQGQTCGRLVAALVARETGQDLAHVEPGHSRPPTRPVPVRVLADRRADDQE